ncbi:MAG: class I SAM-dependent methyltransferase [Gracilimonas sp.]|uniref:class I SAM-dependent methyltransferase n=1 Tax=Gracilimonas sp. TaxID=1974203 RepID=UPI00199441ED|nr:class I SAM-dependent methyltransferase [Gracilimonas sp.]MBD3615085.1 class I SAM-dependent methyltransferase [Gracilimonas sp.]
MEDLKLIADQLRKPAGEFAGKVADKMSIGNRPLYDLALQAMEIKENDLILEIGFGGGEHFKDFLTRVENVQIRGIDYSEDMVERASANNGNFIDSGLLKLFLGNSNSLPFKDEAFDKVFCNMVVYFWEDPAEHLKEIRRVLKPGGKFYTGMRSRESMLDLPFTKYGFNLYTETGWRSILEENEFSVQGSTHKTDPVLKEGEEEIQLESIFITSEKSNE